MYLKVKYDMILMDFDSDGPCNRSQVLYTHYRYDILKMTMTWENKREQNFNVNMYNKKMLTSAYPLQASTLTYS